MKGLVVLGLLFLCPLGSGMTLDKFECELRFTSFHSETKPTLLNAEVWAIRFPGACEENNRTSNIRCLSYGSTDFFLEADDPSIRFRLALSYKHAVHPDGTHGAQWTCLVARIDRAGNVRSMFVKLGCQPHGPNPFDPKDKQWVPVSLENETPKFAEKALQDPIHLGGESVGGELDAWCRFKSSKISH